MTKIYKNIFGVACVEEVVAIRATITTVADEGFSGKIAGLTISDSEDNNKYSQLFELIINIHLSGGTIITESRKIQLSAIKRESMSPIPEVEAQRLQQLRKDGFTEEQSYQIGVACFQYMENMKGNLTWKAMDEVFNTAMELDNNLYNPD